MSRSKPPLGGRRALPRPPTPAGVEPAALIAVHEATRALLDAGTPEKAVDVVLGLVTTLGAVVVPARLNAPDTLPLDLSFGTAEPMLAAAEPAGIPRLHLETLLPSFLEDARRVVMDLRHTAQVRAEARRGSPAPGRPGSERGTAVPGVSSFRPVAEFLHLIEAGSLDAAVALVLDHLEAADSPQQVIQALLAPAQFEVGERWHRGRWTPADEHKATAVTDMALHRLANAAPPRVHRAALAVVCPERDWHTMPARMAAELLRLDGWEVTFLGGSLPAPDLARWLREARPDGLVVSCSMATSASGVRAIGTVATQLGIPVVAGGRGMGRDGRRAAAVGVGWAKDLGEVGAALDAPWSPIDHDRIGQRQAASHQIALRRADIVDIAMVELASVWTPMRDLDRWQLARTAEDFGHILDFAAATILFDDQRVFAEFTGWLTVLLDARGVPPAVLDLGLHALLAAIPADLPAARGVLAAGTQDRSPAT